MSFAFKIIGLAIKTASKSIAKRLTHYSQQSGPIRSMCVTVGRLYNNASTRMNIHFMGHQVTRVKEITPEAAIEAGTALLSETFVFAVAAGIYYGDFYFKEKSNAVKDQKKKERRKAFEEALDSRFDVLDEKILQVAAVVDSLDPSTRTADFIRGNNQSSRFHDGPDNNEFLRFYYYVHAPPSSHVAYAPSSGNIHTSTKYLSPAFPSAQEIAAVKAMEGEL